MFTEANSSAETLVNQSAEAIFLAVWPTEPPNVAAPRDNLSK